MPSVFVPLPPFPLVPPYPGVPPLPIPPGGVPIPLAVLAVGDAVGLLAAFGPPQWGIFGQGGEPILVTDSVYSVEYVRDYRISDYPQESLGGMASSFQSYNKVQTPYQAKVTFLVGVSRIAFLNTVEAAVASLESVTVVTPEVSYPSANLTHYTYRREAKNGVKLLRVEVWCEEVRPTAGVQLSASSAAPTSTGGATGASSAPTMAAPDGQQVTVQSPNGASSQNGGVVQPSDTGSGNNQIFGFSIHGE